MPLIYHKRNVTHISTVIPSQLQALFWSQVTIPSEFPHRPGYFHSHHSLAPLFSGQYHLLRRPYRDGSTHVIFEPLDFIARLAALVPKPRVNLTRFHGVFAPNSKHRALVTPAKRGKGNNARLSDEPPTPAERRASMTWAQRRSQDWRYRKSYRHLLLQRRGDRR